MATITSSPITFLDLTDQQQLSAYLTSNLSTVQFRGSDDQTYNPSWEETNLVITLHAFLKGMLFGIEKSRGRSAAGDVYTRYEPWHAPAFYSGAMRFEVDGKPFYLERNFYNKAKEEKYNQNVRTICTYKVGCNLYSCASVGMGCTLFLFCGRWLRSEPLAFQFFDNLLHDLVADVLLRLFAFKDFAASFYADFGHAMHVVLQNAHDVAQRLFIRLTLCLIEFRF